MSFDDVGRFTITAGRALEREGQRRFKAHGLTVSDVTTVGDEETDEAVPDLNVPGRFQSPGMPAAPRSPAGSE